MSSLVHTHELSMLVLCHWEGGNLDQQFVDRVDLYCCLLFHLLWPSLFRHVMDHSQHLNKIEETWHEILAAGYGKKIMSKEFLQEHNNDYASTQNDPMVT